MPQIKSEKLAQNIGDNACDLDDADLDHDSLLENKEFREDLKRHEDEILDWHNKINSTYTENAFVSYLEGKLLQEIGFKGDDDFFKKLYAMFSNLSANQVKYQLQSLVEAMNDVLPVSPDSQCENIDLNDFDLINKIRPPEPDEHNHGILGLKKLLERGDFDAFLSRYKDEFTRWHKGIADDGATEAFVKALNDINCFKDKNTHMMRNPDAAEFFSELYAIFEDLNANQVTATLGWLIETINSKFDCERHVKTHSLPENIEPQDVLRVNELDLINKFRPPEPDEHNNGVLGRIRGIRGQLLQNKALLQRLSQATKEALDKPPESRKKWLQDIKRSKFPEHKALANLINSTSTSAEKLASKLQTIYKVLEVYKNMPKTMAKPDVQRMIDRLDKESLSVSARLADTTLYESIKNRVDEMFDARSDGVSLRTKVNAVMQGKNPADKFLSEVMISGKSESSEKTKNKVEALKDAIEYFKDQFTPRLTPRPANNLDLHTYKIASEAINVHISPSDDFRLIKEESDRRRLFIANFDGSGLDFEAQPERSNVARIHQAFQALSVDSVHSEYIEGPATQPSWWDRNVDSITGKSAPSRVEAMYDALCKQTLKWRTDNPECKVAVLAVGFSRGAVEAALFNKLVEDRGIYHPDHTRLIDTAITLSSAHRRLYASETPHTRVFYVDKKRRPPFSDRDEKARQNAIYEKKNLIPAGEISQAYLGFDPVATGLLEKVDRTLPSSVKAALQITANDEKRSTFPVNIIVNTQRPIDNIQNNLLNVEVAGAHSDIGGGYSQQRGLGDANFNLATDFIRKLTGAPILKKIKVNKDGCFVHHSNTGSFQTAAILTCRPRSAPRSSSNGKTFNTMGNLLPTTVRITPQRTDTPPNNVSPTFRPNVKDRLPNTASLLKQTDKENLLVQCLSIIRRMIATGALSRKIPEPAVLAKNISEFAIRHGFNRVDDIVLQSNEFWVVQRANRVGVTGDDKRLTIPLQDTLRSS